MASTLVVPDASKFKCPLGHRMEFRVCVPEEYHAGSIVCDRCNTTLSPDMCRAGIYHCTHRACRASAPSVGWDVCIACAAREIWGRTQKNGKKLASHAAAKRAAPAAQLTAARPLSGVEGTRARLQLGKPVVVCRTAARGKHGFSALPLELIAEAIGWLPLRELARVAPTNQVVRHALHLVYTMMLRTHECAACAVGCLVPAGPLAPPPPPGGAGEGGHPVPAIAGAAKARLSLAAPKAYPTDPPAVLHGCLRCLALYHPGCAAAVCGQCTSTVHPGVELHVITEHCAACSILHYRLVTPEFPNVTVRNAGSSAANGVYEPTSMPSDGVRIFRQIDGYFQLYRTPSTSEAAPTCWVLGKMGPSAAEDECYYRATADSLSPPLEGWKPEKGRHPPPTFIHSSPLPNQPRERRRVSLPFIPKHRFIP